MKKEMFYSLMISLSLTYGTTAFALPKEGPHFERWERTRSVQQTEPKSEIVNWEGWVRCEAGSHDSPHDCNLEFVRDDGEVFDLVDSDDLKDLHCQRNADLKVNLTAEKTSRFLFWGGNLIAKKFEVLEQGDAGVCDLAFEEEQRQARNNLRERMQTFEGHVSI